MDSKTFGRYEIKAEIGRGGMATVYQAFDPRFQRDVALKVLPLEFMHDPSFQDRFIREAQVIASIEHPAIVPVYDFGEQNGQPYLVMRYMPGGSLKKRLEHGPFNMYEIVNIFSRLTPAIDEMHSQGIIHRDLKPDNILFDKQDNPAISDFGLVKLTEASSALTGTKIIGTPAYMSPEQAYGDQELDARSDIYSLGVILFEMLTGTCPFHADTPIRTAMKHIHDPIPPILNVRSDLPPKVEPLMNKVLAKKPDARYSTSGELTRDLHLIISPDFKPISISRDERSYQSSLPPETQPDQSPQRVKKMTLWLALGWGFG
ncbi:serine/threonine protein kinase, partial [candidate division CSSED10-310 bacterium]